MKKCLCLILCWIILIFNASAETFHINYVAKSGGIEIIEYSCEATTLVIPDRINEMIVSSIGSVAFSNCPNLNTIVIPDTITSIADDAFVMCNELKNFVVERNSFGEEYCMKNELPYVYVDRNDFATEVISSDNTYKNSIAFFSVLTIILLSLVIIGVRRKRIISFSDVQITVLALISFSFVVVYYIKNDYDNYVQSTSAGLNFGELSLLDMQANTLAITALVVTLASIIITILTIYREKKAENSSLLVEDSMKKIAKAEEMIKALTNIVSIQFIDIKNHEFYYDSIQQFINENINDKDEANPYKEHFKIASIGITNHILTEMQHGKNGPEGYQQIITLAEEIISSRNTTELNKQFAYMEALHALYQKIKLSIQSNPYSAYSDISKAQKYLNKVAGQISDRFGHISNLYGLIFLWSGIAESRTGNLPEAKKHLNQSLIRFDEAISINPSKYEFINHKVVALQQQYDITKAPEVKEELNNTFEHLLKVNPVYPKGNLNFAGFLIRNVREKMGLDALGKFPDYSEYKKSTSVDYHECLRIIRSAKERIDICQKFAPYFVNGYYKMLEALTIEILLLSINPPTNDKKTLVQCAENANKCIERTEQLMTDCLAGLYCEYAYRKLMGEDDRANEIRKKIDSLQDQKSNT